MRRITGIKVLAGLTACAAIVGLALSQAADDDRKPAQANVADAMRRAAIALLDSLEPELRKQATFDLKDEERKKWSNLPATMFERKGVSFGEMSAAQRVLAHHLIQSPLSSQGYLKAAGIMRVDEILKEAAARTRPGAASMFGQDKYWIGIFGDPTAGEAWGWQLDGHHLALNFTVVGDEIAVTPAFLGSDPAEVRGNLDSGFYALAKEDARGRALFESLDQRQQAKALLEGDTPRDVIAGPGRAERLTKITGLPAAGMTERQRQLLTYLLHEYLGNLEPELAKAHAARIHDAGIDKVHFSWAGTKANKPYYYRIHGPTILIEFDNSYPPGQKQGLINHIHTVWRDTDRDYGEDLLRKHYETSPHHENSE
ncbi:MAG: DUF3500 domain-containing protein [Acidobacteriota bacterium]|nr:DUF3500 domain-containing protein [Acidobacteriota bacterium]MDH3784870.1 DUF3500 domain-containing protein [Acidobacteriota bacterium]